MQRTQEAMRQVYEVADFVRATRRRLRFGELSRAPIQILRLQLRGDFAECDWMTRPPDVWDSKLPLPARNESTSRQALADAMALPLETPSPVMRAKLCGFRFELENGFLKPLRRDDCSLPGQ